MPVVLTKILRGVEYLLHGKQNVLNFLYGKFVLKSDSCSKAAFFPSLESHFEQAKKGRRGRFLHNSCRFVQFSGCFLALFYLDTRFCKHAKFSKVNASEKFGVDFFQHSAVFFIKIKHKYLHSNWLESFPKTRFFSVKNFLAQNIQILEGVKGSEWVPKMFYFGTTLTKFQKWQ